MELFTMKLEKKSHFPQEFILYVTLCEYVEHIVIYIMSNYEFIGLSKNYVKDIIKITTLVTGCYIFLQVKLFSIILF